MGTFWKSVRYLFLSTAFISTAAAQSVLWVIAFETSLLLALLWLILLAGWLVWAAVDAWKRRNWPRISWGLPVVVLALVFIQLLHLPTRIAWLIERPIFEGALKSPAFAHSYGKRGPRIGRFHALQIDKTPSATRFVLTSNEFIWSGTNFGYAHCPNGCGKERFRAYFIRESMPRYLSLGGNWYAWTQDGSDD